MAIAQLHPDVFINFRGRELRGNFISHVVAALEDGGFKYYIDRDELQSIPLKVVFTRIEESKIALTIFSKHYGESDRCLNELWKIMREVEEKNLKVIPIFFNVTPNDVACQVGEFGTNLTQGGRYYLPDMMQWEKDLSSVVNIMGLCLSNYRDEQDCVKNIIAEVKRVLATIPSVSRANMLSTNISTVTSSSSVTFEHLRGATLPPYEQRLKQFEKTLDFDSDVTQIVGIVGMPGIGKTKLAKMHYEKWKQRFKCSEIFLDIREKSETREFFWLEKQLLNGKSSDEAPIFKNKSFIVLDDVSKEKQIEFLLRNLNRIKMGSKIVITTRDKSWIKGLLHVTYVVPGLNDIEALQLFSYYAFNGQDNTPTENIINMSKMFVEYAGGNPRALTELGKELCGKHEARWRDELEEFLRCWNEKIRTGSIISYNEPDGINTKTDRNPKEAETVQAETNSRRDDGLHLSKDEDMTFGIKQFLEELGDKWYLESVNTKTDRNPKEAETVQTEAKLTRDDGLHISKDEDKTFGIKPSLEELGDKLDLNKIRSQLGMIIGCLLLLFFCLQQVGYMSTRLLGEGSAIDRIVESIPKVVEYISAERTENPRDKVTEVPTCKYGAKPGRSSSDAKTNADFLDRTFTNPPMDGKFKPLKIQVFINFRGDQLRKYFISYLADALRKSGINIFIDTKANIGDDLSNLFKRIEDSGIAIVVFSSRYTESEWCLNELVKIKERVQQGQLKVLPIFYKVTPGNVKRLKGEFGDNFREQEYKYEFDELKIKRWKEAIVFVSHKFALTFDDTSVLEIDFIETIVKEVLKMLQAISTVERGQSSC